jgi:predicted pyridoxine 5'-phosphate oxidase superfamily flavin-nucleotide-binding protein
VSDEGSPFHAGEQAIQELEGVRERIEEVGRKIIRDWMPAQHREFFQSLPFLVAAALDRAGRPWATLLSGAPGFAVARDSKTLEVRALPAPGDPLAESFGEGEPVGLLGIEFETRRRNRLNGVVAHRDSQGFTVAVSQSFGNCPQYIQARHLLRLGERNPVAPLVERPSLSSRAQDLIARADTFFIASVSAEPRGESSSEGLDVSHRGGKPGFVRIGTEASRSVLTVPDFRGNFQFNTLGNLLVNPLAAVLFVDFTSGTLLTLTGKAEIVWTGAELESFEGAERLVRFYVEEGRSLERALPLEWSSNVQPSPHLARTGEWPNEPSD